MKQKKSITKRLIIGIGIAAVVLLIVALILQYTVLSPNRSAKNATNQAFDAVYNCRFNDFVEATIYNPDCMLLLGLNLSGELYGEVQPYFEEAEAYLKENTMRFSRKATTVEEFGRDDEGYKRGIELIHKEYPDAFEGKIEKVARAVIKFTWSGKDENGKKESGEDTDISWSICVDGKWYVVPNVDESLE
ncbi:MAG: hypothetical protein IK055_03075 [Lachnospiraceae bacterium]|nr:hypothetical protein [Lachnospiraceae bacterium]